MFRVSPKRASHPATLSSGDVRRVNKARAFARALPPNVFDAYDAVSISHPVVGIGLLLERRLPAKKTVLFPMLLTDEYKKFRRVSRGYVSYEQELLQTVRRISSPTKHEQDTLVKRGIPRRNIHIVPRGFDPSVFPYQHHRSPHAGRAVRIVSVGAVKPQKQLHHLIDAVAHLVRGDMRVELTIVGECLWPHDPVFRRYAAALQRRVTRKNLSSAVHFTGVRSQHDVARFLAKSDIAVFPSIAESFGKAVLEAIASGIPTIVSRTVPAYRAFARPGITALFSPPTPRAYASNIKRLLEDRALYDQLSRNGKALRTPFAWSNIVPLLERVYAGL